MEQITRVIRAIEEGDAGASDRLLPLVYEELRSLAARKLAHEPPGQTLQATALVHEAYLRLIGSEGNGDSAGKNLGWDSRTHFFAAAAEAMRRILIDNARRKQALCHGGGRERIELDDQFIPAQESSDAADMIALSDAHTCSDYRDYVREAVARMTSS